VLGSAFRFRSLVAVIDRALLNLEVAAVSSAACLNFREKRQDSLNHINVSLQIQHNLPPWSLFGAP